LRRKAPIRPGLEPRPRRTVPRRRAERASRIPALLVRRRQATGPERGAAPLPRKGAAGSRRARTCFLRPQRARTAPPHAATPPRVRDFKTDVGIGLRMSVNRAPSGNVYKIDFAYALDRDPKGRRGLVISFSAAQVF